MTTTTAPHQDTLGRLDALRMFVDQAALAVKGRLTAEDRDAAVQVYARQLGGISEDLLFQALDVWTGQATDAQPHFQLPGSTRIRAILADVQGHPTGGRDSRGVAARPFIAPSKSFLEAHRGVRKAIEALWAGAGKAHDHHDKWADSDDEWDRNGRPVKVLVPGNVACPVCGPAGDKRRQSEAELLATLPSPRPSTSPCQGCDGHSWVYDLDGSVDGYREVSPCPVCNPYYATWAKGL